MDQSATSAPERPTAVRTARSGALQLLLPAASGERREPAAAPAVGRTVPGMPVLRQPAHGHRAGGQPQTHPAADAHRRHRSPLPKPNLSRPAPGHEIYPYLLRGVSIERPNQVWSTDITYIPMRGGFLYLVAIIDWFSRFVLSWELSNTMETGFCLAALGAAFRFGQPEIWNSDQGSQFTSADFLAPLKNAAYPSAWMDAAVPWTTFHRASVAQPEVRTHLPWRLRQWRGSVPALDRYSTSTIISARTRRSAITRRQSCSRAGP